jgi:hypothetical protein
MTTIVQAFDTLRQSLELTAAEHTNASNQAKNLRTELNTRLPGITRDFISGSFGRRTATRPLHDIDLFLVLDSAKHADVYPSSTVKPSAVLEKVQAALVAAYPNNPVKLQTRSVNIQFTTPGIGYDVVPAFETRDGQFMIPDVDRGAWINTNPEAHKKALADANIKAGSKLDALIKMAKHWKSHSGTKLRSFHLEVMAYGAFTSPPATYPEGLRDLFAHLATSILSSCPVPADIGGPNIDAGMTQTERTTIRTALTQATVSARQAIALNTEGRTEEAHGIWRGLLGPVYPERGR